MKDVLNKLNIYDQFGYILVGLFQLMIIYITYLIIEDLTINNLFNIELSVIGSLGLTFICYFLGHIIQALANIFTKENKDNNEFNKDILERGKNFFNLEKSISNSKVFTYCYLYSLSNDFSGHISLFNSIHSFYRGLYMSASISAVVYLGLVIPMKFMKDIELYSDLWFWIVFLLLVGQAFLFRNRRKRFFKYLGDKTLITFDILMKGKVRE